MKDCQNISIITTPIKITPINLSSKELHPDDYKSQCLFVYTIIVSLGYIGENSIAFDGEDKCDWGIFFKKTRKEKKEYIWKNGIQKSLYELSKEIDQQA